MADRWEKGDLEERVLKLDGDLGRGCTGGVWVRGEGGWVNEESNAWVRKGEAGSGKDAKVMEG